MTATALAAGAFAQMGAKTAWRIPAREEGHGVSPAAAEEAARRGARVLVSVDCGVDSEDGIARARELGLSVCITDHHPPKDGSTTAANCVVHPRGDGAFAGGNLAGVGVAFYAAVALRAELRARNAALDSVNLADWLDLVALGTVADCAPLDAVNRALVGHGINRIRKGPRRPGIDALFAISGRDPARAGAIDMSMAVAPRINAAGRIGRADAALRCLLAPDIKSAREAAGALDAANEQRKILQKETTAQVLARAQKNPAAACFALFDESWHPGVVGLAAGTLADRRRRPAFVFTGGGDGQIKGSGRAPSGFDLHRALAAIDRETPALLASFGGHARAAGVALARADFDRFVAAFESHCRAAAFTPPPIEIDSPPRQGEITARAAAQIARIPWGVAFEAPRFVGEFDVLSEREITGGHTRMRLANGSEKYWATRFRAAPAGRPRINALYQIEPDGGGGYGGGASSAVRFVVSEIW